MRKLTLDERENMNVAWQKYYGSILGEGDIYSFEAGFKAGIEQAKIEEIKNKIKELEVKITKLEIRESFRLNL